MQAYSDFRVNCYTQTVIDPSNLFLQERMYRTLSHIICKPLMMFCTLLCKCKWHALCLNPAIVRASVGLQTR